MYYKIHLSSFYQSKVSKKIITDIAKHNEAKNQHLLTVFDFGKEESLHFSPHSNLPQVIAYTLRLATSPTHTLQLATSLT